MTGPNVDRAKQIIGDRVQAFAHMTSQTKTKRAVPSSGRWTASPGRCGIQASVGYKVIRSVTPHRFGS